MPRISVVVPIYNVEAYLEPCLESLARQTVDDLEAVLVDDGSTDRSAEIAEAFVSRDPRFKLIRQANGGLSAARNTGIDAATGEFLAFLDSDDALPHNAYELLLGALDSTGSDFASGNVHRLSQWSTTQSRFLAKAFATTRLKTHVTQFRPLLADRTAWNKLFRRSFWDRHGLRFPEGVVHEDIPVVIPAHFMADSVDVLSDPVYLYRVREDGNLSITQRRLEQRVLLDRLAAVEHVSSYLAEHGPKKGKRWYDESVVADDLRLHLNILDSADDDYRELFLDRVNAFLDTVDEKVFEPLLAIDRLKWHLVRRRLMPELIEVLRFQREALAGTPPVQSGGRWYGDYPFRGDSGLAIPESIYRLDQELPLNANVEQLRADGDQLHIRGYAYINGIGASTPDAQRLKLTALRPGRLRRLRLRATALTLRTKLTQRPDVTADSPQAVRDVSWSGFEATLDTRRLRRAGRWVEGTWDIYATSRSGRLTRRRSRFSLEPGHPISAVDTPVGDGFTVKLSTTAGGRVTVDVRRHRTALSSLRVSDGETLELSGDITVPDGAKAKLEVRRKSDSKTRSYPLVLDDERRHFTATVPLKHLRTTGRAAEGGLDGDLEDRVAWEVMAVSGKERIPLYLPADLSAGPWPLGGREVSVFRTRQGMAALVERAPRPRVTAARWTAGGALEVQGDLPPGLGLEALIFESSVRGERHEWPADADAPAGRFAATLTPAGVRSLAGVLPLGEDNWFLLARLMGEGGAVEAPVVVARAAHPQLPLATVVDHKSFALGVRANHSAVLAVTVDLDVHERGGFHQRRLQENDYPAARSQPLRDAVLFTSFGGRQYSDSPRAIHEELVRRGSELEQLWVVRDGRCAVPPTATVVREGSREYYEAMATARYVVSNDHFPGWFDRRPDQVCLQTWHGTPLKRLGLDVSDMRKTVRRFQRKWDRQVDNWQYVLSPNRFATPILRQAYAIEGEMLETGYPRVDHLAGPDREARTRALRERLGLPEDKRIVLYAPTYRDQVVDRKGRFRLDQRQLEIGRLRETIGHDSIVLFRKHHYIVDAVPTTPDGFVRDVSDFPDGTELMLAADVLVTDYSSLSVDFANTGRPMLFFTYDLDTYGEEIRGFYLDFVNSVPGPLLHTSDELAAALADIDAVQAQYAERYAEFRRTFCELDDGRAAARVVDRIFGGE
jgi:CDP-glycerol glycerophosphotransferase